MPPLAGKLRLVDNPVRQVPADGGKQPVAPFRFEVMLPTRLPLFVHPVQTIQPLDDRQPALFCTNEKVQPLCPRNYKHRPAGWIHRIVMGRDPPGLQTLDQFRLERGRSPQPGGIGQDANAISHCYSPALSQSVQPRAHLQMDWLPVPSLRGRQGHPATGQIPGQSLPGRIQPA